jgi:hypothetical protein
MCHGVITGILAYAKECARWATEAKQRDKQELLLEMANAWTNIALAETDAAKQLHLMRMYPTNS